MPRLRLPQIIADQPWLLNGSPAALLLTLASVVAVVMAVWLYRGGPRAVPHEALTLGYINPKRYPNTPFTTSQQDRKVVYSSTSGPIGQAVFMATDLTKTPPPGAGGKPDAKTVEGTTLQQQLAAKGYAWTPESFISAARQGDVATLLLFLKNGFDPKQTNAFGNTALHVAAEANQPQAVKLLIAAGAGLNTPNGRGFTPLYLAAEANLPGMAQLLLAAGAGADTPGGDGQTPLFAAVQNNNADIAHALLAAGAKATTTDFTKSTPLHAAVRKGFTDMAKLLMAAGAQVNAPDVGGTTPLHITIQSGNYQLAKMLLDNGATATLPTSNGTTPMNMALEKQNMAIANLLLAHGAQRPNALGK